MKKKQKTKIKYESEKNSEKSPKFFSDFFFLLFFPLKSRNSEEFTKLSLKMNHEIARITNSEITKCGDPLYRNIDSILRVYVYQFNSKGIYRFNSKSIYYDYDQLNS